MPKRRRVDGEDSASDAQEAVTRVAKPDLPRRTSRQRSATGNADGEGNHGVVDTFSAANQRIILNVGGKRFETYTATLKRHPNSSLAGTIPHRQYALNAINYSINRRVGRGVALRRRLTTMGLCLVSFVLGGVVGFLYNL